MDTQLCTIKQLSGFELINGFHTIIRHIAGLIQTTPYNVIAMSMACRRFHKLLERHVTALRDHVWHSGNTFLTDWTSRAQPDCSLSTVAAAAAVVYSGFGNTPNGKHKAVLRMYEAMSSKDLTVSKKLSHYRPGQHYELFNDLDGYYTLEGYPIHGRYQLGRGYPYVGLSRAASTSERKTLCVHPPENALPVVASFVCPYSGIYWIDMVSFKFTDLKAFPGHHQPGRIYMQVYQINRTATGTETQQLGKTMAIFPHRRFCSDFEPRRITARAESTEIAFAWFTTNFCCASLRVTWRLRHGVF